MKKGNVVECEDRECELLEMTAVDLRPWRLGMASTLHTSPIMSHLPRKIILPVRKDTGGRGKAKFEKLSTLNAAGRR